MLCKNVQEEEKENPKILAIKLQLYLVNLYASA